MVIFLKHYQWWSFRCPTFLSHHQSPFFEKLRFFVQFGKCFQIDPWYLALLVWDNVPVFYIYVEINSVLRLYDFGSSWLIFGVCWVAEKCIDFLFKRRPKTVNLLTCWVPALGWASYRFCVLKGRDVRVGWCCCWVAGYWLPPAGTRVTFWWTRLLLF